MTQTFQDPDETFRDDIFFEVLKNCSYVGSGEIDDYINERSQQEILCEYFSMIAIADSTILNDCPTCVENALEEAGRISLAYENLRSIPRKMAEQYATQTRTLDLCYNDFKNLSFLSHFKGLHTLILDRNYHLDETTFPYLPNLEILWINNCDIKNVPKWIFKIQTQCPNIRHLSLMKNPGARTQLCGSTNIEEFEYRNFIFDILPTLVYLDGQPYSDTVSSAVNISNGKKQQDNLYERFTEKQNLTIKLGKRYTIKDSFRNLFRFRLKEHRNWRSSSST